MADFEFALTYSQSKHGHYTPVEIIGYDNNTPIVHVTSQHSGRSYTAKIVDKQQLTQALLTQLQNEVNLLSQLKCDHVVPFYGIVDCQSTQLLLTHHYPLTLRNVVDACGYLPEWLVRNIMSQLIEAISYIHHHGMAHQSISLDTCYIDHHFQIKIGNFEHGVYCPNHTCYRDRESGRYISTYAHTPSLHAKLEHQCHQICPFTRDYHAIANLLPQLFGMTSYRPSASALASQTVLVPYNDNPETPDMSAEAYHFLRLLIAGDDCSRASRQMVSQHPFLLWNHPRGGQHQNGHPSNGCDASSSKLEVSQHDIPESNVPTHDEQQCYALFKMFIDGQLPVDHEHYHLLQRIHRLFTSNGHQHAIPEDDYHSVRTNDAGSEENCYSSTSHLDYSQTEYGETDFPSDYYDSVGSSDDIDVELGIGITTGSPQQPPSLPILAHVIAKKRARGKAGAGHGDSYDDLFATTRTRSQSSIS